MLTLVCFMERDGMDVGACLVNSYGEERHMTIAEAKEVVSIPEIHDLESIDYQNININSRNSSYALMELLGMVKTLEGWNTSKQDLDRYLNVGDYVDDGIFDYVLCVLPPEYWSGDVLQMGEPVGTRQYGHTWLTLKRVADGHWVYCGNCYKGQTTVAK